MYHHFNLLWREPLSQAQTEQSVSFFLNIIKCKTWFFFAAVPHLFEYFLPSICVTSKNALFVRVCMLTFLLHFVDKYFPCRWTRMAAAHIQRIFCRFFQSFALCVCVISKFYFRLFLFAFFFKANTQNASNHISHPFLLSSSFFCFCFHFGACGQWIHEVKIIVYICIHTENGGKRTAFGNECKSIRSAAMELSSSFWPCLNGSSSLVLSIRAHTAYSQHCFYLLSVNMCCAYVLCAFAFMVSVFMVRLKGFNSFKKKRVKQKYAWEVIKIKKSNWTRANEINRKWDDKES